MCKNLKSMVLLSLLISSVTSAHTIYLSRHAEKVHDDSLDPVLTAQGHQRAINLAGMLSSANIEHVFATDYQRTQLTAKPMAELLNTEVIIYDPSDLSTFAHLLKQQSGNVLVIGHSNTTPQLTELLSGQPVVKLSENDFDYLFQVVINGTQKTLTVLKTLSNKPTK